MVTTWLMMVGMASVATALGTGISSNSSFSDISFFLMVLRLLSRSVLLPEADRVVDHVHHFCICLYHFRSPFFAYHAVK